jgi:leucyl-tRNA synthetase
MEYEHSSLEKKWQDYWDQHKTFKAGQVSGKKLYCLDMFPYPSGDGLHIGHPLGYTATDIYSRYFRMKGYSVLHPMGFDAFGLPTEQHAVKVGQHPAIIAEKNCGVFRRQLKSLGYSYDWDRELSTCTPDYYKWTQWIFLKLYDSWFDEKSQKARPISELPIPTDIQSKGATAIASYQAENRLAYYTEAMVNWCPELGSVLANEEVINGLSERGGHPVIKRPMKQWMLRITTYAERLISELSEVDWPEAIKDQQRNWIGKKQGTEITFKIHQQNASLVAFTTRPDTLFGVTFFVISPEHPMVADLTTAEHKAKVEEYCQHALKMSELDRTIENRKKTGVFSGSYVVNPINSELVPVYIGDYVLMSFGTGCVMGVPAHDERDFEFARTFQLDIRPVISPPESVSAEQRTAVAEGEVAYTEAGIMTPCAFPVAKELGLAGKTNGEATDLINGWLVSHGKGRTVVNYKLRDWLFSRQRYWGEPIPVIHWEDGTVTTLSEAELPLKLPDIADFKPSQDGQSPLAKATDWLNVTCPKSGKKGRRETNTMPNWAGSCWYYLRYIDNKNDKQPWDKNLEKDWMSVDVYVGGAEHAVLHLLYARFWHKVLYDLGYVSTKEPFKRLINQGMILAHAYKNRRGSLIPVDQVDTLADGTAKHKETGEVLEKIAAKMSKSLKNVVNPDEIVKQYGADTLRLHMMFMGPLEGTRMWDSQAIIGVNRFIRKSWRFVVEDKDSGIREVSATDSDKIQRLLHKTIKKVTEGMESFQFNTPIAALMEFLNEVGTEPVSKSTLEIFTKLLAPMAPHISEELWNRLGHNESISAAAWPAYDESLIKDDAVNVVIQIGGKKRGLIEVSVSISQEDLKVAVIKAMQGTNYEVSPSDRFITVFQQGTSVPRLVNIIKQ